MNVAPRIALLALLTWPLFAAAEETTVYRWTDAAGQVHFGQIPPESGRYEVIQGRRAPAATPDAGTETGSETAAAAGGETDQRTREQKFIQEAEARRKAQAEEKAKARTAKLEAEKKCTEARARVTFLEERTGRRLATVAEDGNYTRMPEDEFMKRLGQAQQAVTENCR